MLELSCRSFRARAAAPAGYPGFAKNVRSLERVRAYAQLASTRLGAEATSRAPTRRFTFALSLSLRRDPQSDALQVPRVPPQASWSSLADRPLPTFWQDLGPLHLARQPALEALGGLQHWLRTSAAGNDEEREASAYWLVCRAQAEQEQQTRARLRRGEGVTTRSEGGAPLPASPVAGLQPPQSAYLADVTPAWASAAVQLAALGLIAPALTARAQADGAQPAADEAAAAGTEGAWGAHLAGEVLRHWRMRHVRGAGRAATVSREESKRDGGQLPAQAYARCWRELVLVAAMRPASLLPAPGTRRQLALTFFTDAPIDEEAAASPLRPATGAASAAGTHAPPRWDLLLESIVPDEPGPGATWRLRDALA